MNSNIIDLTLEEEKSEDEQPHQDVEAPKSKQIRLDIECDK